MTGVFLYALSVSACLVLLLLLLLKSAWDKHVLKEQIDASGETYAWLEEDIKWMARNGLLSVHDREVIVAAGKMVYPTGPALPLIVARGLEEKKR